MRRESGYSLMEVVVAFTVLMIAGVGLFYTGTLATSGNTAARDHAAATALAIAKIEELKNAPFDDLASGSDGPLTAEGNAGGIYTREWGVYAQAPDGVQARAISVDVFWGENRRVSLQTLVVDPPEDPVSGSASHVQSWTQVK